MIGVNHDLSWGWCRHDGTQPLTELINLWEWATGVCISCLAPSLLPSSLIAFQHLSYLRNMNYLEENSWSNWNSHSRNQPYPFLIQRRQFIHNAVCQLINLKWASWQTQQGWWGYVTRKQHPWLDGNTKWCGIFIHTCMFTAQETREGSSRCQGEGETEHFSLILEFCMFYY